jgi:cysteine desulfurase
MIYLDHNATAPLCAPAREAWLGAHDSAFATPSSLHRPGQRAERALDSAREQLADYLGSQAADLVWTSGATESANAIIAHLSRPTSSAIAVSEIEHPCVLEAAQRWFEGRLKIIPTDSNGVVRMSEVQALLSSESIGAVAVMAANNETGALQPWREIQQLCTQTGVPFVCDATQWIGRLPASDLGMCDYVFASGHKFGAPVGIGFLKLPANAVGKNFRSLLLGGPQEDARRAGTQNVAAAIAFVAALKHCARNMASIPARLALRARIESRLREEIRSLRIIAEPAERLWNTIAILAPAAADCRQRWVVRLDAAGVAASSGSACSSGKEKPSHVLAAMGLADCADRIVRLSGGWETTEDEWDRAVEACIATHRKLNAEQPAPGA